MSNIRMRYLHMWQFVILKNSPNARFTLKWSDRWPCYDDATAFTGFDKHYIYHTAWACRLLSEYRPNKHVDIASSLYFSVTASAFIPVDFYDYRPADIVLSGLGCKSGDLMHLPFIDNQVESLSCMHVIEHVGLGRYGDPLDYDGDIKAARELTRVTAPGGNLLIVVPVGRESRIQFNAHRIYRHEDVVGLFPGMHLQEFSLIPDDDKQGGLIRNADKALADEQRYGCGCFHFRKQ